MSRDPVEDSRQNDCGVNDWHEDEYQQDEPEEEEAVKSRYSSETMKKYLPQLAGKAIAENLQDLSDAEIERVFSNTVLPKFCIGAVKQYRNAGGTLEGLISYDAN